MRVRARDIHMVRDRFRRCVRYEHKPSEKLADALHPAMVAATGLRDRGIRSRGLGVLKARRHLPETARVLVEIGFLTEPTWEAKLADEDYLRALADGMAGGICTYLRQSGAL